ncbi:hypothetical protein HCZ23_07550 [Celeribacter sp. HF31]|uniref:hypothetical protein n=1 Tax=Celeribacter sp. HF31 TaxID=2721558 RepID=UPI0014316E1E|nr:hypothetical protein [Celeribacter sp. HF31]NIY79323.1 hypothetical protein [Celeribacter sp. HF31]
MIRILGFICGLALLPYGLLAETIDVRSGEHAGFSRLVMQFPTDVDWEFGRLDGQYEFRANMDDITFNTGEIFQKIPRSRIENVEVGAGYLRLTTPDNVHADVFELRAGRIVIDIKDGAAPPTSSFEAELVIANKNVGSDIVDESVEEFMPSVQTNTTLTSSDGDDGFTSVSDDWIVELEPVELPIIISKSIEDDVAPNPSAAALTDTLDQQIALKSDRVDDLERQLLEQIGRAVSQGLLEPDVTETEKVVEETRSYQEQQGAATHAIEDVEIAIEEPVQERSHIRIQSSIDREQNHQAEQAMTDGHGTVCLDNSLVQITDWGKPLEEGLDIPERRAATIGEFDLPHPEGVKRLAQYYLYLTFGAEAKSVLTDFGVTVEGHDILSAMADIMDQGYTDDPGRLAQQFGCDGAVAFWSVMAKENLNTWETYNLDSVLSTFSALPIHLRRYLGPPLSERFIAINDLDSAKYIQNAILRTEGDHGDAFDLLDAELELVDGNLDEGVQKLENIVDENGDTAPEALVRLILTKVSEGAEIDKRLAENAEAMAVEFRGSAYEGTLQNAAFLARIYSGGADIALRQMLASPSAHRITDSQKNYLLSQALEILARDADDATFLKIVLAHQDDIFKADIANSTRLKVSERLLDMGFFEMSLDYMSGYSGQDEHVSKLILAKAFLGLGEAEAALRYASQVEGQEARNIASRAYFYLNDPDSAARILAEDPSTPERDIFSMMAEDWESLGQSDKSEMSTFADVMKEKIGSTDRSDDAVPTLSDVEDMLSSSRDSRSALETLLN